METAMTIKPRETQTARRYRVTLWADVILDDGEPMYGPRELEKHLIQVLRKAEPECDVEVMDYEDIEGS